MTHTIHEYNHGGVCIFCGYEKKAMAESIQDQKECKVKADSLNNSDKDVKSDEIDEITGKIHPKFLDIIENGWASKDNPHRVGIFIKKKSKTLLLTDGKGDFFEPFNDDGSKLKIIGNLKEKWKREARVDETEMLEYQWWGDEDLDWMKT